MYFRFGLSYTTFSISNLVTSEPKIVKEAASFELTARVRVANTGAVSGAQVVQLYVTLPDGPLTHPPVQLRAFARTKELSPGDSEEILMLLDRAALGYWDERAAAWRADAGVYTIRVGTSAADTPLDTSFKLKRGFSWKGI
jgi:beta-glucosidase